MTAEDILNYNESQAYYNQNSDYRIKSMKEYARLKCQELLEIVVEKAKIKEVDYIGEEEISEKFITKHYSYTIDRDSILNTIDLEKFCY